MRLHLEMQMMMPSRLETSMVRPLILMPLMGKRKLPLTSRLWWNNHLGWTRLNKGSLNLNCLVAGQGAQQVHVPVPEGCTDPTAENYDPTARSDDGSCTYKF